jgi:hypothetical protein
MDLTPKQARVLDFFALWIHEHGRPPTFQERASGLDLTEKHARGCMYPRAQGLPVPAAERWLSARRGGIAARPHGLPLDRAAS